MRVVSLAALTVFFVFTLGANGPCVPVEPSEPVPGERCEGMGGVCQQFQDACPDGTLDWTPMDCPLGRSGKCCLPATGACEDELEGTCVWWTEPCPEGTGGTGPMDCEAGRSSQCCVPLE